MGYETAHGVLRREGWQVNRKRIQRLWRDEGLKRPAPCRSKRRRLGDGSAQRLRSQRPGQVWSIDFQFHETAEGR